MAAPDIKLLGTTYPSVTGVTLPKNGGGTASFPFVEGTKAITSSGNTDVTNYATASVAAGSATPPATISGSGSTISTSSGTITLSKTVSVTPSVSAGYVSSGTAGNASVSLSASATIKAATTYHPSTSDQTISSGTYTTGAQTIKGVLLTNLLASIIKSGEVVKVGDSTDDDCVTSVTGTYSGGGTPTSGLVYETGTYTPSSNIAKPTISFANTHTTPPVFVAISDVSSASGITSSSNITWSIIDHYRLFGAGWPSSTTTTYYGLVTYNYRGSSNTSLSSTSILYNSDDTGTSTNQHYRYWATASAFNPGSNSNSRYWRSGRTYKWIAVWI